MKMTQEDFKRRWESGPDGDGITNDDCADCYVAWGLGHNPRTQPIELVVDAVVRAAGCCEIDDDDQQKAVIHEHHEKETVCDIAAFIRERGFKDIASRLEAACRREAESIERIVRDAIIDYQEMYAHAPNDDAERDLKDRAKRGNSWLAAHGYEPEKITWSKEETPCL